MTDATTTLPRPLAGVRLIDMGQVLASPFASFLLGTLGAEVVKVEPPKGEFVRAGGALGFATQNAGKKAIAVDLTTGDGAGAEVLLDLAEHADVFLEGFAPGTAEAMGLGFDAVAARNPEIVYASLSAFGADGPFGGRPGFDHVVQAVSGIMEATGFEGQPPTKVGSPYLDYGGGLLLAFATLAGVLEQRRVGGAVQVDVTMLDAGLIFNIGALVRAANDGVNPPRTGNQAFSGAVASGAFETADGLLSVAANKLSHYVALCQELGLDHLVDEIDLVLPGADPDRVEEARAAMRERFTARTAAEWEQRLAAVRVPAARVRSLLDVVDEGHVDAWGLLFETATPDGPQLLPGAGVRLNGVIPGPSGPVPAIGEHTDEVLAGVAGYDEARIAELRSLGVIA